MVDLAVVRAKRSSPSSSTAREVGMAFRSMTPWISPAFRAEKRVSASGITRTRMVSARAGSPQ